MPKGIYQRENIIAALEWNANYVESLPLSGGEGVLMHLGRGI